MTPYFQDEHFTLYKGDYRDVISEIPDNSIDMVVSDPPYHFKEDGGEGMLKNRGDGSFHREILKRFGSEKELDIEIDFYPFFERKLYRNNNINGALFCTIHSIHDITTIIRERELRHNLLIWHKTNPIPLINNRYLSDKELILQFRANGMYMNGDYHSKRTVFTSQVNREDKKQWKHPTIKPLPIIETLITNHTNTGDTILDTFIGTGTTAIAARNNNRKCIGADIDEEYLKIAVERYQHYFSQRNLFEV